jgi:putative ABC transport system ATP-binding protein
VTSIDDRPTGGAGPGAPSGATIVEATGLVRDYPSGETVVHALRGVDLTVRQGELLAIRGRSGSGKTTLLNLLGGLDRPTAGRVVVAGREVTSLGDDGLVELRRGVVSFIFQTFGLLPILSVSENVEIPLRLVNAPVAEREQRVREALEMVGLAARAGHRPFELSGGEQQRVAIARAVANRPQVLLADEPTGQLDSETGQKVMRLIQSVVRNEGVTAIVATHDPLMLDTADRVLELRDGVLGEPEGPVQR